ncbi:hypothetical protein BH23THE1_BH23THE1_04570 [soil metagenome]
MNCYWLISRDSTGYQYLQWKMIILENSAARLDNETDNNVVDAMKRLLHNQKYDSLLTDNGSSQFNKKNSTMRRYCDQYLTGKHIWTSIHHPQQTMGNFKCSEGAEEIFDT